jgi:hypothetical protein
MNLVQTDCLLSMPVVTYLAWYESYCFEVADFLGSYLMNNKMGTLHSISLGKSQMHQYYSRHWLYKTNEGPSPLRCHVL